MGIVAVATVPNLRIWTSRMRLNGATTHIRASIVNPRKMAITTGVRYCLSFAGDAGHAYLIRGHGLYTWAADIGACYRQLEALETLLAVELDRRRLG